MQAYSKIVHKQNHNFQITATFLPHPCQSNSFQTYCYGPSRFIHWKCPIVEPEAAQLSKVTKREHGNLCSLFLRACYLADPNSLQHKRATQHWEDATWPSTTEPDP